MKGSHAYLDDSFLNLFIVAIKMFSQRVNMLLGECLVMKMFKVLPKDLELEDSTQTNSTRTQSHQSKSKLG